MTMQDISIKVAEARDWLRVRSRAEYGVVCFVVGFIVGAIVL